MNNVLHLISRGLEVKEHLPDEHAPALLGVPVFHLGEPPLDGRFVVFFAQQKFGRVSSLHVLENTVLMVNKFAICVEVHETK